MTPIDDDPETPGAAPRVLTYGGPQVGEVLAERYRLEEHIGDDGLGRQLWRGSDVILQRPVTVVLRYPGGDSAVEMLSAAVAASRIVHPHLVGVYDAIDEDDRAYVVREWVEGSSLRAVLADYGPLEPDKAVAIGHAISDAIAALHHTGMAHGNVQPGTVLIGYDGRVVLADARAGEEATPECDLRAVGAVLYCALTGHWPHAEAGAAPEPDALRGPGGEPTSPRQVRAGIPDHLDRLTSTLLDTSLDLPSADDLTADLARLDRAVDHRALFNDEPLDLDVFESATQTPERSTAAGRKMAIVIAALLVIAIAGTIAAARTLSGGTGADPQAITSGTAAPGRATGAEAGPIKLTADQVRIVDPQGDGTERDGAKAMVDGNLKTQWRTDAYNGRADFGGRKQGMGVLVDLGRDTAVTAVELQLTNPGATVELRGGATDPGATNEGDTALLAAFTPIGEPKSEVQTRVLLAGEPDKKVRFLLIWFTKLPPDGSRFRVGVVELTVRGQ